MYLKEHRSTATTQRLNCMWLNSKRGDVLLQGLWQWSVRELWLLILAQLQIRMSSLWIKLHEAHRLALQAAKQK